MSNELTSAARAAELIREYVENNLAPLLQAECNDIKTILDKEFEIARAAWEKETVELQRKPNYSAKLKFIMSTFTRAAK